MRTVAIIIGLILPAISLAQCSGGSCASSFRGPVGPSYSVTPSYISASPAVQTSAPVWEWRKLDDYPGQLFLFRDGIQVGAMDTVEGYYRPYDGSTWGPKGKVDVDAIRGKVKLPETVSAPHLIGQQQYPSGGVEADKIGSERYRCRDQEHVTKVQAMQMIADVPSYHLRQSFTVIGTPAQTAKIREDAKTGPLAQWLQETQSLVQFYEPTDWAVRPEAGFVHDGSPTIYWQDKRNAQGRGPVLFHGTEYVSPDALVATLRRADPNYDRKRDPNGKPKDEPAKPAEPTNPDGTPISPLSGALPFVPAGGLLLVLLALFFRR